MAILVVIKVMIVPVVPAHKFRIIALRVMTQWRFPRCLNHLRWTAARFVAGEEEVNIMLVYHFLLPVSIYKLGPSRLVVRLQKRTSPKNE